VGLRSGCVKIKFQPKDFPVRFSTQDIRKLLFVPVETELFDVPEGFGIEVGDLIFLTFDDDSVSGESCSRMGLRFMSKSMRM
jgi:hypothetical protein